jgi:hypothetical protein
MGKEYATMKLLESGENDDSRLCSSTIPDLSKGKGINFKKATKEGNKSLKSKEIFRWCSMKPRGRLFRLGIRSRT